uniref:Uncharacterized protein n=1 Tax=viral metagenome TaxID=1070528 RepID=A0A6M3IK51_9ZZZZ
MNNPIIIKTREPAQYVEVEEEWSYEKILDIFTDDDLVYQLTKRCQQYEEEINQLKDKISKLNKQSWFWR